MLDETIPGQFLIIIFNPEKNQFNLRENRFINLALSGGILLELILTGRLAVVRNELVVIDETPSESSLINTAFEQIKAKNESKSPLIWIRKLADSFNNLYQEMLNQMESFQIIKTKIFFIFPSTKYKLLQPEKHEAITNRLRTCCTKEKEIEPKNLALLSLLSATNTAGLIFEQKDLEKYLDQVRSLVSGENIGRSVEQSIQDLTDALLRTYINSVYIY